MKFMKRAVVLISLCVLVLISLYVLTNQGMQNVIDKDTEGKLQELVNEENASGEFEAQGVLGQGSLGDVAEKYRMREEVFSYANAHKESPSGVQGSMEAATNAKNILDIADIKKMEAGSILDTSRLPATGVESLFYSEELSAEVQQRIMGISYQENDNISLGELRYLRVLHMGFDGQAHIGELLVNVSIATDVLEIMRELFENGYAIEKMVLVDAYGADDEQSMEDNNTSAFNYREIAGSSKLSRHSLGLAIDINPLYNPCVKNSGASISPANAGDYADRSQTFAHKIDENDLCYRLFLEHGFTWGGSWHSLKDYQHFEK